MDLQHQGHKTPSYQASVPTFRVIAVFVRVMILIISHILQSALSFLFRKAALTLKTKRLKCTVSDFMKKETQSAIWKSLQVGAQGKWRTLFKQTRVLMVLFASDNNLNGALGLSLVAEDSSAVFL